MIALPGVCRVCREPVVWNGHRWREAGGYRRHVCPVDRPTCGAWMPHARELCARTPGHAYDHRSRYAMDNARAMRSGRAVTRASVHNRSAETSSVPNA